MILRATLACAPVVVVACLLHGPANAQPAAITWLGDLPGGPFGSEAMGVSDDGQVICGSGARGLATIEPTRWKNGNIQGLGYLEGGGSGIAGDVSPDGRWISGLSTTTLAPRSTLAFLWSEATGMFPLGDLPGGETRSFATGVSLNGGVVVGASAGAAGFEAFRWTPGGGMKGIGFLPGGGLRESDARDISRNGQVIVGSSTSSLGYEAYRWTEETGMVALPDLPGGPEQQVRSAYAVSSNGLWTAGENREYIPDDSQRVRMAAVRWTPEGDVERLGILPGSPGGGYGRAVAISDDGSIVVGDSNGHPFIWTPQVGMMKLEDFLLEHYNLDIAEEGWRLNSVYAMTPDGMTLVGAGFSDNGTEAYVITLPAPNTLGVVVISSILALHRRRSGDRVRPTLA